MGQENSKDNTHRDERADSEVESSGDWFDEYRYTSPDSEEGIPGSFIHNYFNDDEEEDDPIRDQMIKTLGLDPEFILDFEYDEETGEYAYTDGETASHVLGSIEPKNWKIQMCICRPWKWDAEANFAPHWFYEPFYTEEKTSKFEIPIVVVPETNSYKLCTYATFCVNHLKQNRWYIIDPSNVYMTYSFPFDAIGMKCIAPAYMPQTIKNGMYMLTWHCEEVKRKYTDGVVRDVVVACPAYVNLDED